MFSLIMTIIAIALVAALALAMLYYGNEFATDGAARAQVTRTVQEGNQLVGAFELYKADHGSLPTGTQEEIKALLMTGGYLTAWPDVSWELRNDYAVRTDLTLEGCKAINTRLGVAGDPPSCSDATYSDRSICCVN